jgi:ATP-dependent helicase HrpA
MTLTAHGYHGLHPVLPVEWAQASKEEMYAKEDTEDEAYLGVGEVVAPGAAVGEVEVEEDDPVTWLDQWKWAMEVEPDRKTLFGLTLSSGRSVPLEKVDPALARELFIRHALVDGDWQTRHHFFADNTRLRAELTELEDRARRRDLLVGDDEIYEFYQARIPAEVASARHFDGWWRKQRHRTPDLLTMTRSDLLRTPHDEDGTDLPDQWQAGDLNLPLSYRFEPGAEDDGVTVHVPVGVLARLGGAEFGWQVPALREELLTALIRSLP